MEGKSFFVKVIAIIVCCGLFLISCNNSESDNFLSIKKTDTVDLYSSYSYLGIIHNAFMTNVDRSFEWREGISTFEECIEYLSSFNKTFTINTELYGIDRYEMIVSLEYSKHGYSDSLICEDLYKGKLDSDLNYLLNNHIISVKDLDIINNIIDICYSQYKNEISLSEYRRELYNIETQWQSAYNDDNKSVTDFTAIILNISTASADWWIENSRPKEEVPPIVAKDAAGAIVGAVAHTVSNGGKVTGKSVGKSAVAGAVTASVGAVVKVAKVIDKLSKLLR